MSQGFRNKWAKRLPPLVFSRWRSVFPVLLCVSVRVSPSIVNVGSYVSKVTKQKLQVLLCVSLRHCAECAFLNATHIVNIYPFTLTICHRPCLGSPTQFVHKLWLPFGLPIKVTGRFVLIFVQHGSVLGHGSTSFALLNK